MKADLAKQAALHVIDYAAAADPTQLRPLELYVDACDIGWGCTLAQRPSATKGPDGKLTQASAPRPIAIYSKSYNETEQAWSTFERELCGLKESLAAVEHLVKGFPLTVYTDHKNNIFTDSLYANKRLARKLLRWTLEIEEMGLKITRVWIKGTDNILGDAPSRNPRDRDAVLDLRVPAGPVKRIIRAMFHNPEVLDEEVSQRETFLEDLANLGNPQMEALNQCDLDVTMGGEGDPRPTDDGNSQAVKCGRSPVAKSGANAEAERKGKSMNEHQPDEVSANRLGENDTEPKYGHKSPLGPEKDLDAERQQAEAERERVLREANAKKRAEWEAEDWEEHQKHSPGLHFPYHPPKEENEEHWYVGLMRENEEDAAIEAENASCSSLDVSASWPSSVSQCSEN
ncbi:MAG: Ty3/Gypsy family RNase HI domain-containing protein, partial [Acidimicrobiales bacterium]|nr:Ty3/Gypsy family RNase HI domain-containing protein [Acidimicrobiales bacterium]